MELFDLVSLSRAEIIDFLKTSPEKLAIFESYYKTQILPYGEPKTTWRKSGDAAKDRAEVFNALSHLANYIVLELVSQTTKYVYDGKDGKVYMPMALPDNYKMVSVGDIEVLPKNVQPEFAGNLIKKDLSRKSAPALLFYLKKCRKWTMLEKNALYTIISGRNWISWIWIR